MAAIAGDGEGGRCGAAVGRGRGWVAWAASRGGLNCGGRVGSDSGSVDVNLLAPLFADPRPSSRVY